MLSAFCDHRTLRLTIPCVFFVLFVSTVAADEEPNNGLQLEPGGVVDVLPEDPRLRDDCPTCPPPFVFPAVEKACASGDEIACVLTGADPSILSWPMTPGQMMQKLGGSGSVTLPGCETECILVVCHFEHPEFKEVVRSCRPDKDLFCSHPCRDLNCQCVPLPCFDGDDDGECDYTDPDTNIDETIKNICGTSSVEECADLRRHLTDDDKDGIPNGLDIDGELFERDDDGNIKRDENGDPIEKKDRRLNPRGLVAPDSYLAYLQLRERGLFDDVPFEQFLEAVGGGGTIPDVVPATPDGTIQLWDVIFSMWDTMVSLGFEWDSFRASGEILNDRKFDDLHDILGELERAIEPLREVLHNVVGNDEAQTSKLEKMKKVLEKISNETLDEMRRALRTEEEFYNWVQETLLRDSTLNTDLILKLFKRTGGGSVEDVPLDRFDAAFVDLVRNEDGWTIRVTIEKDGERFVLEKEGTEGLPERARSTTGDPVDTTNGALRYQRTDVVLRGFPGARMDLPLTRYYSSRGLRRGALGSNWTMNGFDDRLVLRMGFLDHLIEYHRADGTRQTFLLIQDKDPPHDKTWRGTAGAFGEIKLIGSPGDCRLPGGGFVLRQPDGMRYVFCPPSYYAGLPTVQVSWLNSIISPSGDRISFFRNRLGQVTSVVDARGQTLEVDYDVIRERIDRLRLSDGGTIDYEYPIPIQDPLEEQQPQSGPEPWENPSHLLKVLYPPTLHLNAEEVVTSARPYEEYTYDAPPDDPKQSYPGTTLNSRLRSVARNGQGPSVVVEYYKGEQSYEDGRVKAHTVAGKTTNYTYEEVPSTAPDAYGQSPAHVTREFTPEGVVRSFYHDRLGLLVRREIAYESQENGDVLVTLYEYQSEGDYLLISKKDTTKSLYPTGDMRRQDWIYDTGNPNRYQQGNVLETKVHPSRAPWLPTPLPASTRYEYEPITNQVAKITDPIGRVTVTTFNYQESTEAQVRAFEAVAGWNLDLSGAAFGLGDLNGDGKLGEGFRREPRTYGMYGPIKVEHPLVPVANPSGPGGSTDVKPTEMFVYNDRLQLLSHTDASSKVRELRYDNGVPYMAIDDVDGIRAVEWYVLDGDLNLVEYTDAAGRKVTLARDQRGLVLETRRQASTGPQDDIHLQSFYDLSGRLVGTTGPAAGDPGDYTPGYEPLLDGITSYDAADYRRRFERRVYEDETLLDSGVWTWSYDSQGKVLQETTPGGAVNTFVRGLRGEALLEQRTSVDDQQAPRARVFEYNPFGDLITVYGAEDSDGNSVPDLVRYVHDGFGRVYSEVLDDGRFRTFERDAAGRVLRKKVYTNQGLVVQDVQFDLDASDRILEVRTQNLALEANGQVTPLTPSVLRTVHGYDLRRARLWTVGDPGGVDRLTRFRYDTLGRRTATIHGPTDDVREEVELDALGRVLKRVQQHDAAARQGVNPSQSVTLYRYFDPHGRQSERVDPNGTSTFFTYDARNQIATTTDPLGTTVRQVYDLAGRNVTTHEEGFDGVIRTVRREFDIEDRLTAVIDGEGQRTTYAYNAFGNQTWRRFDDGREIHHEYDRKGRLVRITHQDDPAGTMMEFDYDAADRPISVIGTGADAPLVRLNTYDALDHLTQSAEQVGLGGFVVTIKRRYSSSGLLLDDAQVIGGEAERRFRMEYDGVGRLRRVVYPSGSVVVQHDDALGRIQKIERVTAPTQVVVDVAEQHGLLGPRRAVLAGGATIEWDRDANGRILRKELVHNTRILEGGHYGYDDAGNLTSRRRSQDQQADEFGYDGLHRLNLELRPKWARRVSWDHDAADNWTALDDNALSAAIHPQSNRLNQYTGFGSRALQYNHRGELDADSTPTEVSSSTWDAAGRLLLRQSGSKTVIYIYDALDRLVRHIDSSGRVVTYGYAGDTVYERHDSASNLRTEYVRGPHGVALLRNGAGTGYLFSSPFQNVLAEHDGSSVSRRLEYDAYGAPRDATTGQILDDQQLGDLPSWLGRFMGPDQLYRMRFRHYDPVLGRFINRDPLGEAGGLNLYAYPQNPFRWADPTGLSAESNGENSNREPRSGGGDSGRAGLGGAAGPGRNVPDLYAGRFFNARVWNLPEDMDRAIVEWADAGFFGDKVVNGRDDLSRSEYVKFLRAYFDQTRELFYETNDEGYWRGSVWLFEELVRERRWEADSTVVDIWYEAASMAIPTPKKLERLFKAIDFIKSRVEEAKALLEGDLVGLVLSKVPIPKSFANPNSVATVFLSRLENLALDTVMERIHQELNKSFGRSGKGR